MDTGESPESPAGGYNRTRTRLQSFHWEPHTGNRLRCPPLRSVLYKGTDGIHAVLGQRRVNGYTGVIGVIRLHVGLIARTHRHPHKHGRKGKRSAGSPPPPLSARKIGCDCRSVPRKTDFLPDTSGAGFVLPVGTAAWEFCGATHKRPQGSADRPTTIQHCFIEVWMCNPFSSKITPATIAARENRQVRTLRCKGWNPASSFF